MITINMVKAREIYRNFVSMGVSTKLLENDRAFINALISGGDTAPIILLRTAYQDAIENPAIDSAVDADALKDLWDENLLGPAPWAAQ